MAITAAMVKELREMTGAGMMDCKKALNEVDGDMDKAVEFLREKGLAAAAKKASRIAAEGIVATLVSDDKKSAAIVEVNAETDFVAKNEVFQSYVARVAAQVLASNNTTMEAFMAEPWIDDASFTVEQELSQMVAKIGEKFVCPDYPYGIPNGWKIYDDCAITTRSSLQNISGDNNSFDETTKNSC